jgi:HK97 family phage major capsid protein
MSSEALLAEIKAFQGRQDEAITRLFSRVDEMDSRLGAPSQPGERRREENTDTPGHRFIASDAVDIFQKSRGLTARFVVGQMFPTLETKVIDSPTVGFSTPGIVSGERVAAAVVPGARRRLRLRDVFRSRPTSAGMVEWVKENAFTNAASPQVESSAKAESDITFTMAYEKVRTIAHWVTLSDQILADVPGLQNFIDTTMRYGVMVKEETEILSGDNLGSHLNGILPQASAYANTYLILNDTKLDKLRHAALELEDGDEVCDFFVINPKDEHDIDLIKTEDGGVANKGYYLVGDPLSGGSLTVKTYWGRSVVVSNSISPGTFLAGDSSKAEIFDRQDATIDLSREHAENFTKNLVTIRAESRLAIAVLRPTAFLRGTF